MSFSSIGDLASAFLLNRNGASVRRSLDTLSTELTTGLKANSSEALRGDYSAMSAWEVEISTGLVREKTLSENLALASVKQQALGRLSSSLLQLANDIEATKSGNQEQSLKIISDSAKGVLEDAITRLNTRFSGKSIFAGTQTSSTAFAPVDTILTSARAAISGASTVAEILTQLDAWMGDDTSGFGAIAYLGNSEPAPSVRVSAGSTIEISGRGNDPEVAGALRELILASLASDETLAFNSQVQSHLLSAASLGLRQADGALIGLQAQIGYAESRMENAKVATSTEISNARQMRLDHLAADPYETATKLQAAELQLEKIYALTARAARMSLMEYLR